MPQPPDILDVTATEFSVERAAQIIRARGFVVLRNLFPKSLFDEIVQSAHHMLERPAVAGVPGYWKVDHPKKLLNPFILGGGVVDILVNETVLNIVEAVMGSECILAETSLKLDNPTPYVYFPMHTDFAAGWNKGAKGGKTLAPDDMRSVVGVGGAIYFSDTDEGAFAYCDGSHLIEAPFGQNLRDYPPEMQAKIMSHCVRCDGRKGDIVLFDDRGFHGPSQPSAKQRLIILLDYYRVSTFGRTQVSPMPIWSCDIGRLSPRQLLAAGAGAAYMIPPTEYTYTRFKRNKLYPLIVKIIENAFLLKHWNAYLRTRLRFRRPH
jgi:hypothetical protein